jgi:hypothetical protein
MFVKPDRLEATDDAGQETFPTVDEGLVHLDVDRQL